MYSLLEVCFEFCDDKGGIQRVAFPPLNYSTIVVTRAGNQWDVWVGRGNTATIERKVIEYIMSLDIEEDEVENVPGNLNAIAISMANNTINGNDSSNKSSTNGSSYSSSTKNLSNSMNGGSMSNIFSKGVKGGNGGGSGGGSGSGGSPRSPKVPLGFTSRASMWEPSQPDLGKCTFLLKLYLLLLLILL